MTSTTRELERLSRATALIAACAAASAASAQADLIVLTDGASIKVDSYTVEGDRVVLVLPEGGTMTVSIERVDRAIADEVVAAEEIARTQLAPSAFSVRYVEGHDQPDTPCGGTA
jgi:uncharacterized lipoprotein YbaY